jgi:hypothetical protein
MSVESAVRAILTNINKQIMGVAAFRATVTDASGGTLVKIQREGASTADSELYATCSRYTLTNGDVVLCLPLGPNGKPVIVEVIQPPAATGGSLTVQEGDVDVDTAVTTIDFNASQFNVTSSPAGEVNVSLAGSGATIDVQEATVTQSTATAINFDGTDFNVSDSPAGTANISLNYDTVANTPAMGNHTHSYTDYAAVQRLIAIGAPL